MKDAVKSRFHRLASWISSASGSPKAFLCAVLVIVVWGLFGPFAHYSDTWQLIANTVTTLVTFLMGFVIQYTQSRDNLAMHLKLDELIRAVETARNKVIEAEKLSDEELMTEKQELEHLVERTEKVQDEPKNEKVS